ncbi:MAG TPA: hypothetical protein VL688_10450 [Verrucomicrobiae bacterium]|jgi:uncharacterized metal-binding protein YceD (DUF177 family)|nr:hypothetical protein [Verrucomicrobiae bacterium]
MKVVLSVLQEGVPKEVTAAYDPKKLEVELVDLKFLEPLVLEGVLVKQNETLSFKGNLRSNVRRICGKTLKEVDEPLDVAFDLYYMIQDKEEIDTTDDLREAVLLEQPMVYYAPGCENIDVNYQDKDPEKEKPVKDGEALKNSPFEKLKKIRDRLKEE